MIWVPKNKKTGIEYPAIDDATKAEWLSDPYLKAKYTFRATSAVAETFNRPATKVAKADGLKPVGVTEISKEPKAE